MLGFAGARIRGLETYATTNNRSSTVREKRRALGRGLLDELGRLRLDQITTRHVEAFKARRNETGSGPRRSTRAAS